MILVNEMLKDLEYDKDTKLHIIAQIDNGDYISNKVVWDDTLDNWYKNYQYYESWKVHSYMCGKNKLYLVIKK